MVQAVSKSSLIEFVRSEKLPLYLEFTDENQPAIFGSGININVRTTTPSYSISVINRPLLYDPARL